MVAVCVSNIGFWWTFLGFLFLVIFVFGAILHLYVGSEEGTKKWQKRQELSMNESQDLFQSGLRKVTSACSKKRLLPKYDNRLTGSQVIDENLQDIIGYLIRDYIYVWYDKISDDEEFYYHIRNTGQKIVVHIAARMKEVDWIPYLTTRLVDDAASHLRLYRQACAKTKQKQKEILEAKQKFANEISKPQSLQSFKTTTEQNMAAEFKQSHLRNLSGSNIQYSHSRNNSNSGIVISSSKSSNSSDSSKVRSQNGDCDTSTLDLESVFFDLELAMEKHLLCRDLICMDKEQEKLFLQTLVDVLLLLLLPPDDFHCLSFRLLLRDILVGGVLLPLFSLITNPDYINLCIIWLCHDFPLTPDAFLQTLRTSDSIDELQATKELVSKEISFLRSRDSGGDDDSVIKQQLSSLLYVTKVLDNRLARLQEGLDSDSLGLPTDCLLNQSAKLVTLTLDFILKNNVALSYFIDYMTTTQQQNYIFLYLNVEGWKLSVKQFTQNSDLQKLGGEKNLERGNSPSRSRSYSGISLECMKEAAMSIYNQYLAKTGAHNVLIDEHLLKNVYQRINSEPVSDNWFDEILSAIYCKLQTNEKFLPGFYKSSNYIKLLSELELLKDSILTEDNDDDSHSLDNVSLSDNTSLHSLDNVDISEQSGTSISDEKVKEISDTQKRGKFLLAAEIIDTGVVQDRGKTYGIYALYVSKIFENGFVEKWHVYRRYSDFYDLQQKIKDTYVTLGKLTFPGKKTFHNMERATLEKRMKMLNDYLQVLLQSVESENYPKLQSMLLAFLESGEYDKTTGPFAKTFDTLVNPFKASMRTVGQAVRTMPDNLMNTVDEVFDGITKVFQTKNKHFDDPMKVGSSLHQDTDDNIPLRIMLLLMDEVFDLKSRNQWLRRRIVTILRQIIRTMFGDIVNKKIVDYVAVLTCPEQVASYLDSIKQSIWPNGCRVIPTIRDEGTRLRTRIMAKTALFSSLSDELKHIIGSDTTRRGLLRVFHLFQHPVLNRRVLYVLIEGILEIFFPQHNLTDIFHKMHSK
ncbi:hypothetical protein RUM43_012939 [Polyplax serrata]|uniref:Sorting nexin 13 n=1 Tax=Polyplax serrata TaxID=468196 RepID=A0AAN8NW97_POLSC